MVCPRCAFLQQRTQQLTTTAVTTLNLSHRDFQARGCLSYLRAVIIEEFSPDFSRFSYFFSCFFVLLVFPVFFLPKRPMLGVSDVLPSVKFRS